MKVNIQQLLAMLIAFTVSFILLWYLTSCSAQWHLKKFQSKGGICGQIDTVQVLDSVLIYDERRDTLMVHYYTRDSLIIVNDRVVPKTIREIRYEEKLRRDTLRIKEKEIKYQFKSQRNEDRKVWVWVVMGVMALIALFLIKKG